MRAKKWQLLTAINVLSLFLIQMYSIILNKRSWSRSRSDFRLIAGNVLDRRTTLSTVTPLQLTVGNFSTESVCEKSFQWEIPRDATWQPVDTGNTVYVISAYLVRNHGKVYILGAKPMYDVSVGCQLWLKNGKNKYIKLHEEDAKVGTPRDPAGPLPFTAAIFECPVNSTTFPSHVSLTKQRCESPQNNLVYIQTASVPEVYKKRFTVCLAPIFNYGAAHELVEWIELNRILGADKFMVYNYSTASNVDQVIRYYQKQGLIEMIQWKLPFHVINHIHYFGQTAALNDCLFRCKQTSEFITNIDLDEFIIPHSKNVSNWSQMLAQLNNVSDGFIFRNTFFRKEWNKLSIDPKQKIDVEKLQLITMKYVEHEQKIYPSHARGKYIARTARAHFTLIHEVPRVRVQTVSTNIGLLHHYRNWQNYKDGQPKVRDLTIPQKIGDILIQRVKDIWKKLGRLNVSLDISDI